MVEHVFGALTVKKTDQALTQNFFSCTFSATAMFLCIFALSRFQVDVVATEANFLRFK